MHHRPPQKPSKIQRKLAEPMTANKAIGYSGLLKRKKTSTGGRTTYEDKNKKGATSPCACMHASRNMNHIQSPHMHTHKHTYTHARIHTDQHLPSPSRTRASATTPTPTALTKKEGKKKTLPIVDPMATPAPRTVGQRARRRGQPHQPCPACRSGGTTQCFCSPTTRRRRVKQAQ